MSRIISSDRGRRGCPWSMSRWYRSDTMGDFWLNFNIFWTRWCSHRPSKTMPAYWGVLVWRLVYVCNYWAFWCMGWTDWWNPWATWLRYPPWWYTWTRFQKLDCNAGLWCSWYWEMLWRGCRTEELTFCSCMWRCKSWCRIWCRLASRRKMVWWRGGTAREGLLDISFGKKSYK